jgi:opacity protein-like surface antigen
MKLFLMAAVAGVMISVPTAARAGSPYVGIEGGVLHGRENDVDEIANYTTIENPATALAPPGPADTEFDDVFSINYRIGYDVDVIGGYDFGIFRLELELGHKRANLRSIDPDDITGSFLADFNAALNRPSAQPDPGAPGLPALTIDDFDLDEKMSILSAMINGLVDVGVTDRLSLYGGGGYGRSRASALGDKDSAWAWQYMAGVRYAIGPKIDLGIKYRYFNSGVVTLRHGGLEYIGNPDRLTIAPAGGMATTVDQTTNALLAPEIEGRFRTRSLLASLIYNF